MQGALEQQMLISSGERDHPTPTKMASNKEPTLVDYRMARMFSK